MTDMSRLVEAPPISGSFSGLMDVVSDTAFTELTQGDVQLYLYGPARHVPWWKRIWLWITTINYWPDEIILSTTATLGPVEDHGDGTISATFTSKGDLEFRL